VPWIAVVGVAVPADPPKRRPGAVLARLGPLGQAAHLTPAAARARVEVHGQTERVLAARLVAPGGVPVAHLHVVAADQVEHVGQDAPVHARPWLTRDRHEAPAAGDRAQAPRAAGRPVVHPLAGEVQPVEQLGSHGVAAGAAGGGVGHLVAQDDRVRAAAAIRRVAARAAVEPVVAVAAGKRVEPGTAAEDVGAAGGGQRVVALAAVERQRRVGERRRQRDGELVVPVAADDVRGQRRGQRERVVAVAEVDLEAGGAGADDGGALLGAAAAVCEGRAGVAYGERAGRAWRHGDGVVLAWRRGDAQRFVFNGNGGCERGCGRERKQQQ
jgi:hypothetical protein